MRWYRALRQDVEDHLRKKGVEPVRLRLDARVPLGPLLLISLVLLVLGDLIVYAVIPFPGPPELVAWVGTILLFLGVMALLLGSTWWLVIHPLWVRYHLAPRSWLPLAAGLAGLGIAAVGWWLPWKHPFHPLRNWLAWTVFPMGYLLLMMAFYWVLTARHRPVLGARSDGPAYRPWLRVAMVPLLLVTVVLGGLFVRGEWLPYLPLFRALVCYKAEDRDCTVRSAEQALAINPDMVDGYYLRAAALADEGDHQTAVGDLTYLIDSGSDIIAEYYVRRARSYQALEEMDLACTDLRAALDARRWGLSAAGTERAQKEWESWGCGDILGQ
jgi:hypothetical protein